MSYYTSDSDYIKDSLIVLASRLSWEVQLRRSQRSKGVDESFLGLFLTDDEIDSTLQDLLAGEIERDPQGTSVELIEEVHAEIEIRRKASSDLRINKLGERFGLSDLALNLIMLLMAPEVDSRFARVYAYLQDDVTRRWMSPGLALSLLPNNGPETPRGRALFNQESPLISYQLVHAGKGSGALTPTLIERPLKLDDRVTEYLLGNEGLSETLAPYTHILFPKDSIDTLHLTEDVHKQLLHLIACWRHSDGLIAYFSGTRGIGKKETIACVSHELGRPLITVDLSEFMHTDHEKLRQLLKEVNRERMLQDAILHLSNVQCLKEQARDALKQNLDGNTILSSTAPWDGEITFDIPFIVHFEPATTEVRQTAWKSVLNGQLDDDSTLLIDLTERFRLTPGQIRKAAHWAQKKAALRNGPAARPERIDLFDACRNLVSVKLDRLARKIHSPYSWEDLVLPASHMRQLKAIESQVLYDNMVYSEWGFGEKLGQGMGLTVLFSGPSGTGKTMAASILANTLGLDLYKIDLSGVVSKYIGETEKNLHKIFEEASMANIILFFDEADAIFGKRSEVKDAHDRYANIEVSYLLQKMEEYEGISILATNFDQNLDKAFTRRMQHMISFPIPQAEDRERIWHKMFPPQTPMGHDIDFRFLAEKFELSGGNIKNCVLAGAFMAATEHKAVGMAHLLIGVIRELGKLGLPLTRADFGDYYNLVKRR